MNGRQRTQRWLRGIAIRKMVLQGRTVLIARAGEPHVRVALVDGHVTWTKLQRKPLPDGWIGLDAIPFHDEVSGVDFQNTPR